MHVIAAIEVRIVGQALPAHRGARFFHVGAHDQQQFVVDLTAQVRQAIGVFQRGAGIVDRARPDDHEQALVAAFENGANGLAVAVHLLGEVTGQWHLLLEQVRAGQALADGGVGRVWLAQGQGEVRSVHGVIPWADGGFWPAQSALSRCSTDR